ncbi:ATP-binding protein [Crossiella sp. CA-258035]|uniref:ATP-binding protein n=1 Tax=Crossiella sp. CA-258035 TaxID=2981138 RepID=UPI0024BCC719|nr:ATP-binding protein [Crossiella sp. CA-258035]WHT23260.1 ATP-binding protein [Crossiella sp. CA-258035]
MTTLKGFRCWTAESVRSTVYSDIGALPSDADALFLAAHTPMVLSHLSGVEIAEGDGSERDVLRALRAGLGDANRNTLIAVTGESGAGKSHVVRWVHAHWPADLANCHVLYVPRAVQTIRDLLRSIVDGLPTAGGSELLARVENAVAGTSPEQLRDRLLEETRFALTWTLETEQGHPNETNDERNVRIERNMLLGEPDANGKRRHGLADLLQVTKVNETLLQPGGTLDVIVNSLLDKVSRRDTVEFQRSDLPLGKPGVRSAVAKFDELAELWDIVSHEPQQALEVLNQAVQRGLSAAIGLRAPDGENLDDLFREARQTLRRQGRELVLLFEDLAQFGLIGGELYDQLATQPDEDMAPLRAVFAVTDGPFKKIVRTVGTRITHQFAVSEDALPQREAFIARYLNLVRLGNDRVDALWRRADRDDDTWLPNACDSGPDGAPCPMRSRCHAGFGAVEIDGLGQVGLYPYNEAALKRALERPTTPDKPRTPRSDINECVSDTLIEAYAHLGRGTFPHERAFTRFDHQHKLPKSALLNGRTGEEGDRYFRAAVLWGAEQHPNSVVLEAFGLADKSGSDPVEQARPVVVAKPVSRTQAGAVPTNSPPQKPSLPSPLQSLFQWETGSQLSERDVKMYRPILYTLVLMRLDLERDLVHRRSSGLIDDLFGNYFKQTSFYFGPDAYGQRAGEGSITFTLERCSEDVNVLAAAKWYVDHGHWDRYSGNWDWPRGLEPHDLMLSLETRLDDWAEQVRAGFLAKVRVKELARAAVGVRAIALMCCGEDPRNLTTLRDALAEAVTLDIADGWEDAAVAARALLDHHVLTDIVAGFASARQGTGEPQLLDFVTLETDLHDAVTTPTAFLESVAEDMQAIAPQLAKDAKGLLTAIQQSGAEFMESVIEAQATLADTLEGAKPRAVVAPAEELARQAVKSGFFRPADGKNAFLSALEVLRSTPDRLPLTWRPSAGVDFLDSAVRVQSWAGATIRAAVAMRVVRDAVARTEEECRRNTPESSDVEELEQRVRTELDNLSQSLQALSNEAGAVDV